MLFIHGYLIHSCRMYRHGVLSVNVTEVGAMNGELNPGTPMWEAGILTTRAEKPWNFYMALK